MFDQLSFEQQSTDLGEYSDSEPLDLRAIISANDTLPYDMKTAAFTRVEERLMDRTLLTYLSELCPEDDLGEE